MLPTAAFGVTGRAVRLPGGGGTCWQVGDVILKPDHRPVVGAWLAEAFATLDGPGFRVPRPVRAGDGSWVVDGWAAWTRVGGEPDAAAHWPELVRAGRAFHEAIKDLDRPRWVDRNLWSVADRVAWGEESVEPEAELSGLLRELAGARRPIELPNQVIHGDLAGNVLFEDGEPPAVIDFSPRWRPAGYALAIAAVDVLTWSNAPDSILDELAGEPELDQLLIRALIFRLVCESLGRPDADSRRAVRAAMRPVVGLMLGRVESGGAGPEPGRPDGGAQNRVARTG